MKDYLLKGIKYMEDLPPSKWNPAIITLIKSKYLPKFREFVEKSGDQEDIVEVAKEIFEK